MSNSSANIQLLGIEDLKTVFKRLPYKVNKKLLVATMRSAAKPIVKYARRRIKGKSKTIAGSIGIKTAKSKTPAIWVGPRTGKSLKYNGWFARFYEKGTSRRKPRKNKYLVFMGTKGKQKGKLVFAKSTAKIQATPFMRPAIDANIEQVKKSMAQELRKVMIKEIKKYNKKRAA